MIPLEIQKQITEREYLILNYIDEISRIQDKIDVLDAEIKELKKKSNK